MKKFNINPNTYNFNLNTNVMNTKALMNLVKMNLSPNRLKLFLIVVLMSGFGIESFSQTAGIQTVDGNVIYRTGSEIDWRLFDNAIDTRGTDFDGIDITGNLDFEANSTLNLVFNESGSAVDWTDAFWETSKTGANGWKIFEVEGTVANLSNVTLTTATDASDINSAILTTVLDGNVIEFALEEVTEGTKQAIYLTYSIKSTDASLANLLVNDGSADLTLDPLFAPATLSYTAVVETGISGVTLTPTTGVGATVTVAGTSVSSGLPSPIQAVSIGINSIDVVVTAEDEVTTQTYTVNVIKEAILPGAPTLDGATANSFDIGIDSNGNPSDVEFAVRVLEQGGSPNYLQVDGTLGVSEIWRTLAQWHSDVNLTRKTVTGLNVGVEYTVDVKARISGVETVFGPSSTIFTCLNPSDAGVISGNQTICFNSQPNLFTSDIPASGFGGTLEYKWQFSTIDPSLTTIWNDLSNSDSETFQSSILTQNTWFRRLARVNCKLDWTDAVVSNIVLVSIESIPPTITAPSNITLSADAGECFASGVVLGTPVTSDNCAVASVTNDAPSIFPLGTNTVTWTVTDTAGNTASDVQLIFVEDKENPVLTCIGNQTVDTDTDECTYTHIGTGWDATATDNCSIDTIEYVLTGATTGNGTSLDGVVFNLGTTTVTWTATDGSTNTDVCSYTVTVEDNQDPVITCIGNQTVDTDTDECTYTHIGTGWDATATDNCSIDTIEYVLTGATTGNGTSLDGVVFNLGTTTVTWTATDGSTNTDVCSYTVTVEDNQDPEITCIANQTVDTDTDECTYTHIGTGWDATATDNCSIDTIEYVLTGATTGNGTSLDGVVFNLGTTTVTWTATDGSNNTDVCSYTVTVEDKENPVITCGVTDQTVNTDVGFCTYTHSGAAWDATPADNCAVSVVYTFSGATPTPAGPPITTLDGMVFNIGTTTVSAQAVDASDLVSVPCTFDVVVSDPEAPVITCVGNQTVDTDAGFCSYTHSGIAWDATATDNCTVASITYVLSGATTGTGTTLNGVAFNLGTTTVTWTVTDAAGNTDTCSYTVTVVDNQAPVISGMPANITQDNDAGACGAAVSWTAPSASDNCAIASFTSSHNSGDFFPVGTTTVTYTATDVNGLISTASFTITVVDNENPVIGLPANIVQNNDLLQCGAIVTWTAPTVSDNCLGATINQTGGIANGGFFSVAGSPHTVEYTATDAAGNSVIETFTVTVNDTEGPHITSTISAVADIQNYACGGNFVIPADLSSCVAFRSVAIPTWGDNCGTVTATTFSADNGVNLTNFGTFVTANFPVGVTTVTFTATDNNNNTTTCSITIEIVDTQNPTITGCPFPGTDINNPVQFFNTPGQCSRVVPLVIPTAQDNCAVVGVSYVTTGATNLSGTEFPNQLEFNVGITVVTYTVTDAAGLTATCSYAVQIIDNELPTALCVPDFTIQLDANGQASITPAMVDNGSFDNCAFTLSLSKTNFTCSDVGANVVTLTVTDASGNATTCQVTVTVEDNVAPVASCVAPFTIQLGANGQASITVADIDGGSSDACGIASRTISKTNFTCADVGPNVITLTVTDNNGNVSTCTTTVTVIDNVPPIASCVAPFTIQLDANGQASITVANIDNGSSDACGIASRTISKTNFTCADLGPNVITLTVTDNNGNVSTCTTTVTVVDTIPPAITCVTNQVVSTNIDVCTYTHVGTSWNAVATDNCSVSAAYVLTGATTGSGSSLAGVTFNLGTTTVTWTATDSSGNTAVCSFTVLVQDTQIPTVVSTTSASNPDINNFACGAVFTFPAGPDTCFVSKSIAKPTWIDNCTAAGSLVLTQSANNGVSLVNLGDIVFGNFPVGTTVVTYTATDIAGNTAVCTVTIVVEDTQFPVVVGCPTNQTVNNDPGMCSAVVNLGIPSVSDNCGVTSITYATTGATVMNGSGFPNALTFNVGVTSVTYSIADAAGNTVTCSFTVTVNDVEAPVIACSNITQSAAAGMCSAVVNLGVTVTDNCSASPTLTGVRSDGQPINAPFPVGTTTIVWNATDAAGNAAQSCTQTVTITDDQAPAITGLPANISVNNDAGVCGAVVSWTAPGVTDNCAGATIAQTAGLASGAVFPVGTTTVSYTATDASGNTTVASFTVTVTDNEAPVASCVSAVTISLDANGIAVLPIGSVNLASSDNCGIATLTLSQNTFTCAELGENTVTMTVTDVNGNVSTCTVVVTVVDTIAPVAQCVTSITVSLDANGLASITPADVDNGSSDNCDVTLTLSQSEFTCADLGTNTITLTATDSSGNASTCTVTVVVIDEIAPVVVCNDFTLALGPDGTAILDPAMIGGGSTDNCAITITAVSIDQFDCGDIGAPILVTYFATDASGNSVSCNAFVTVVDTLAPVVECPEDMLVDTDPDSITYTVPDYFATGMATAIDNCTEPVTIFSQTPAPGTLLLDGTYTVTLTATDAFGNTGECEFQLTVETTLGIDSRPDFGSLTMYPNPAASKVTIGNPNGLLIDNVAIYDINGRLVRTIQSGNTGDVSVDVSDLSSAVYMVIITGEDGASTVKRLIKK